ncbi:MAG: ATP-grasp fold amidoligase family protein [Steroidobacter sp.]
MRSLPENRFGDRFVSRIRFVLRHRRLPCDATTYNDVIYRIKTTDEILDPLRVFVSDKEFVKLYVKAVVGDEYNVPTIGLIRSAEAVDTYDLPPDCCIKPTHASGLVILRRNGEPVDRQTIKSWFRVNYYLVGREANYKMLAPKVIVEPLIFESSELEDYKVFCLNGAPKIIQVDVDRHVEHKRKYFDADWNELDFSIKYPKTDKTIARPANLSEMLSVAAALSRNFWFVRVDLYSDGAKLLVGEITHCPDNAGGRFIPLSAEHIVSEHLFGKGDSAAPWPFVSVGRMRRARSSC